jgi:hypothetical protein
MRSRITIQEQDLSNNQQIRTLVNRKGSLINLSENSSISEILASEGRLDFYSYIKGLGLTRDNNLVFLSSIRHYYYDEEEMKNVQTVVNLKGLNQIKQIKDFLHSIHHILTQNSNFIGFFIDNKKVNGYKLRNNFSIHQENIINDELENGVVSPNPFLNMLYSFMDLKTNKYLSGSSVSMLLEDHGFKVLDMKEVNGLTYFHAQKVKSADY